MGSRRRYEFRVVIDGADISDEAAVRINSAVQKAAMTELAGIDLGGDFRFKFPIPRPRPPWWGLWVDTLSTDQIGRAGLPTELDIRGG